MLHVDRFNKDTEDLLQRSAILTSVKPSFNVTPTLLHGLATFATKNIMAGDIITQEKPIVSTRSVKNEQHALLCDCCHCPIEHLRQQLLHCLSNSTATKNDDVPSQISNLPFPALGYEPGPSYTQHYTQCEFCPVIWCATCSTAAQPEHLLLCKQATVENRTFHEHSIQTDPAYLLAAVVLVKSLVALHTSNVNAANFLQLGCWWKEYNHPLWEELDIPQTLNETKQERKKDCQEAHFLLVQALTISVTKIYGSTSPLLPWMQHNITLETYSQIMGMLSCNVMEIDFPSPVREYFFTLPEHQEIQTRAKSLEELNNNNNNNSKKRKRNLSEQDKEWESIQLLNKSIDDLIASTPNCVGQGLYPVLSLSNHSCDPNASIEFLNENNTGSMVALRNIQKGEEITITYVPNGEDTNFNPDRFRHFKPTRTWKYFDNMVEEISSDEDEEEERVKDEDDEKDEMGMNGNEKKGGEEDKEAVGDEEVVGDEEEEEEEEGTSWQERRDALLSYGFVCRCSRCVVESAQEKEQIQ